MLSDDPPPQSPVRTPHCKEVEAALLRVERLLDRYDAPGGLRGRQSVTWIRSRLWATANTLNRLGPPTRVRPKIVPARATDPFRIRKEIPEEVAA